MKLDQKQERLLASVREVLDQAQDKLDSLRETYERAEYQARRPVIDAIRAAQEGGVPFNRITKDAMGMTYPGKLKEWMTPPDSMLDGSAPAVAATPEAAELEKVAADVQTVTRDPDNGEFTVHYDNETYRVEAFGPDEDCWTSADARVPQQVYDIINTQYGLVILEDD